jgi:hypothetical protein
VPGGPADEHAAVTLARICRPILLLVATVTVAAALAGCTRGDPGQAMTIWNRTSAAVEVDYRLEGTTAKGDSVATIAPGQRVDVFGLYVAGGDCIRGTLVATQDGREIGELPQPCRGTEWEITSPEMSVSTVPGS